MDVWKSDLVANNSSKRFWEIDFLRGIAIIMMIVFHILYDINYFNIYKINLSTGYILIFNYSIGTIFLLLVGISLTLSYARVKEILTIEELKIKFLKRGLKIFLLGILITGITWYFLDEGFVVFGVLHCIGVSIIFAYPFLRLHFLNLMIGTVLIIVGLILRSLTFDFFWLVWLGFKPYQFYSIDFFPILPWFGVVLVGIFLGNSLYVSYKRVYKLKDLSSYKLVVFFNYLGRHSLVIYFLHHIILLSIIYLIFIY